jgi:membrane fusion protein, macrolide-specific efflux system
MRLRAHGNVMFTDVCPMTFKNRRAWIAFLVVVLAALAAAAYHFFGTPPAPPFVTAPVVIGDIDDTVLAAGEIEAVRQVSVGAQVSGQIKSLKVALGDRVKQGQLIAEIDSMTQQNSLRNAEAALISAQAQLLAKHATLAQAQLAYDRQRALLAGEVGTQEDLESARAALDVAKAEAASLQAQIDQARITADTARVNLAYTRITAPIDGTVVAIISKEGQTVNANQSAPTIIKLAQMDKVTVKAEISEADVPRVLPGQTVYFTILGLPDKRFTSRLRAIEPAPESISTDSTTSTTTTTSTSSTAIYYNGLFDVPNPDGVLRISMTAQVHIVLASAQRVLTIPATALGEKRPGGSYRVMVVGRDGRAEPRSVNIGINNKVIAQVLGGLREGERVILAQASSTESTSSRMRGFGPPPM